MEIRFRTIAPETWVPLFLVLMVCGVFVLPLRIPELTSSPTYMDSAVN